MDRKELIESQAKEQLKNLSKDEIESKAKRYKKFMITIHAVISLVFFLALVAVVGDLLQPTDEAVSLGSIVLEILCISACIIGPLIAICWFCKKPVEYLALAQIKLEIKKDCSDSEKSQAIGAMNNGNFVTSKSIKILANGCLNTKLLIDDLHKLFIYQRGRNTSKAYRFSDLINYEVYENGQSKVKGRAGSALIGGAFFGLTGLVIGSSRSRKIEDKCNQLQLIIRLNDLDRPQIVVSYANKTALDKTGRAYRSMKENLQLVCSTLEYIMNAKTLEQSAAVKEKKTIQVVEHYSVSNNQSLKEQLQELKEMLYCGLITEEEYENKRNQILK